MASLESTVATLVFVAASTIALASCDKEKPATEAPAGDEPSMEEPAARDAEPAEDAATSGAVDHEAMSHGDAHEGGEPPPDEG